MSWEETLKLIRTSIAALATGAFLFGAADAALAKGHKIAVSWKTFQEERWKTDEKAIKTVVEANGDTYISADAQLSPAKQASDIESLISQKVDVILIVAFDSDAILPSIKAANDAGVKLIAYDVLFEDPKSLYITFDNIGVGKLMAQEIFKAKPAGNYAFIKGDKGDPNATFLFSGITEVLKPGMDSGKIKNVCETFTDGWKPDNAQKEMEQCLTKQKNKVDAVVSENDGMASGVVVCAEGAGHGGLGAGLRPGRRSGRDQSRRARHADRVDLEGLARPRQGRRRGCRRHRRWQECREPAGRR